MRRAIPRRHPVQFVNARSAFALAQAQARECLFEKLELQSREPCDEEPQPELRDVDVSLDLAQEASQVGDVYGLVHDLISAGSVKDYVPFSWVALARLKREYYTSLAHFHCATGLLARPLSHLDER